jgi:integrase
MSMKRVANVLSPLRIAFRAAVKRELIHETPFFGFQLEKRKSKTEDVAPFSSEEQKAILGALQGQARNFVQFAFWTGLRTSELIALDWGDIDWIRGIIIVSKTMTQGMASPEVGTKTKAGRREVKLLQPALDALNAQKAYTLLKGAEIFQRPGTT